MRNWLKELVRRLLGAGGYIITPEATFQEITAKIDAALNDIHNQVNDVRSYVGHLGNQVDEVRSHIGHLGNQVDEVRSHIGHLGNQVDDVRSNVGNVQTKLEEAWSHMVMQRHEQNAELAATKGGISGIQAQLGETHSHVISLRHDVTDLNERQNAVDAAMGEAHQRLTDLETALKTLRSQFGEFREIPRWLDEAAQLQLFEGATPTITADGHDGMAAYYAGMADLVSQYWVRLGQTPPDLFPDDDLTLDYAARAGVYDTFVESDVDPDLPFLPWRHLWFDPDCAVLLTLGQSNAANAGEVAFTSRRDVYAMDFLRMRCSRAADPLAGASGTGGSIWPRLGDLLIDRAVYRRVLVVPLAFGGSFIADWVPGGNRHSRLALALSRLRKALGSPLLPFSAVLWQQGEAEANNTQMSAQAYKMHFHDLVGALRANGVLAPLFVACSTLCQTDANSGQNRTAIREAQRALANEAVGILAGPDLDTVGVDERFDGCHLSERGLQHCAELWFEVIEVRRRLLAKLLPPGRTETWTPLIADGRSTSPLRATTSASPGTDADSHAR